MARRIRRQLAQARDTSFSCLWQTTLLKMMKTVSLTSSCMTQRRGQQSVLVFFIEVVSQMGRRSIRRLAVMGASLCSGQNLLTSHLMTTTNQVISFAGTRVRALYGLCREVASVKQ